MVMVVRFTGLMGKSKRVYKAHSNILQYCSILVKLNIITNDDRSDVLANIDRDCDLFKVAFGGKKADKANALVVLSARNCLWRMEPRDVL